MSITAARQDTGPWPTISQVAERYNMSTKTIRRRIADGTIDARRIGRLIRINPTSLQRMGLPLQWFDAGEVVTIADPTPDEKIRLGLQEQLGTIYYLRVGEHIKIGFTKNLDQRLRSYPPSAVLLAISTGTRDTEMLIHQSFADALDMGNEWFRPTPELMRHIAQLQAFLVEQRG